MSITLRRKMFKLGGETNTHGIGITSGLEYRRPGYNAGGQVAPIGSDVYPKVMGPDGQMREAHNIGMAALNFILPGIRPAFQAIRGGGLKGLQKYIKGERRRGPGPAVGKYGGKRDIVGAGDKLPLNAKDIAGRIGRGAGLASLPIGGPIGAIGLGRALGERAGVVDKEPDTKGGQVFKDATESVLDFSPAQGFTSLIRGAATPTGEDYQSMALSDFFAGRDKAEETVGSDNDTDGGLNQKDISPAMETALTQEEQFAKMKADADARAEMYYAMLGGDGPNKVRALADAFTAAGALYDEDKSQALAGFSEGIQGELDRDEAVRDEARRLGLQEVVGLRDEERMDAKSRKQMVEQAKLAIMTSADMTPEQRQSTIRGLEAFELGVVDLLPTNDKGDEIDTGRMSPGSIYLDVNGITDGKYVAVSNDSNDPNQVDSFNNISEAEAHARS